MHRCLGSSTHVASPHMCLCALAQRRMTRRERKEKPLCQCQAGNALRACACAFVCGSQLDAAQAGGSCALCSRRPGPAGARAGGPPGPLHAAARLQPHPSLCAVPGRGGQRGARPTAATGETSSLLRANPQSQCAALQANSPIECAPTHFPRYEGLRRNPLSEIPPGMKGYGFGLLTMSGSASRGSALGSVCVCGTLRCMQLCWGSASRSDQSAHSHVLHPWSRSPTHFFPLSLKFAREAQLLKLPMIWPQRRGNKSQGLQNLFFFFLFLPSRVQVIEKLEGPSSGQQNALRLLPAKAQALSSPSPPSMTHCTHCISSPFLLPPIPLAPYPYSSPFLLFRTLPAFPCWLQSALGVGLCRAGGRGECGPPAASRGAGPAPRRIQSVHVSPFDEEKRRGDSLLQDLLLLRIHLHVEDSPLPLLHSSLFSLTSHSSHFSHFLSQVLSSRLSSCIGFTST